MFLSGIADEAAKGIREQIRAHLELGWKHIEIRLVDGVNLTDVTDEQFNAIYDAVTAASLQVSCFASKIANWAKDIADPESFRQDKEELARAIPRMHRCNTPFIRVMSYANPGKVAENEWRDVAIERIRELAKMAEDGGITLLHENCDGWGGLGPDQTNALLAAINSPALKTVFDTGNTVCHGQDPMDYYRKTRQHIAYIHIKDAKVEDGKVTFMYPGDGQACIPEIIRDLKATGYEGGVSIEPHVASIVHEGKAASPEECFSSYVAYGRRLIRIMEDVGVAWR